MKKILMIGFVFISTLTFADSGSLSLNFGDGHRRGTDVAVSLNIGDDHHHRYERPRYVEKEVYIYEQPRYVKEVHVYEQPRYVKEVHRHHHPNYNHRYKNRHKEPQKVVVIHKYEGNHYHNAPYGQAKKHNVKKGRNNRNKNWRD
ncbi:hypothetical protein [uncultured Ilyobacter sp.]|uniref:hypothetical protein n=1 Tax=uncultured Ilyobacter sp. TaxID=544433 RepID=UPI0029C849D3|nr:hypothetical protein [uncultured Ilyobacter sp.]